MARTKAGHASSPHRLEWRFDVSEAVDLPGSHQIAVSVVAPAAFGQAGDATVLCCLPGGSLSRKYWDLEVDGDRRFSFAEFMAARGFATLAIDHLGVGASTQPDDGYALDLMRLARANQAALTQATARLRAGDASEGRPPLAPLRSMGVGHSMGSCMTVVQQAHHAPHAGIVLMSFTTRGLPHFLNEGERAFAGDPHGARAKLPELIRARFGTPAPAPPSGAGHEAAYAVGTAPPEALLALRQAATALAAGPGILSMIPGAFGPEAAAIDVPVFLAVGDHDLHSAEHASEEFPHSPEVVAYTLPDCWHCHNVANTRERLWSRIARWIGEATQPG
jgi:alpha-beta hydrolase superfamily lysophospholipase